MEQDNIKVKEKLIAELEIPLSLKDSITIELTDIGAVHLNEHNRKLTSQVGYDFKKDFKEGDKFTNTIGRIFKLFMPLLEVDLEAFTTITIKKTLNYDTIQYETNGQEED